MSISPQCPRPEYPRPLLVREAWANLNGTWRFIEDAKDQGLTERWFESGLPSNAVSILVPFSIESRASLIGNTDPEHILWYERDFEVPIHWSERVVVHIGASDYWTRVFVNGQEVGQHQGGYSPMTFDIGHALRKGVNRITVRVEDSLSWTQPRGKQAGTTRWPIDYDSVTGIWQSVWLEPLAPVSIDSTHVEFSLAGNQLTVTSLFSKCVEGTVGVNLYLHGELISSKTVATGFRPETRLVFQLAAPKLWSPESPTLYDMTITLEYEGGRDVVESYLGIREMSVSDGQVWLNGKQLYIRGVLDQGYFDEGWYTAISDDAIRRDVELTLAMGFNCARKHQKAEDPRYLYWADRLGLMVWAEMPSGKIFSTQLIQSLTSEWMNLIRRDRAHPSVIAWVPFNESWGVWHQSERPTQRAFVDGIVGLTHALDSSRPVIGNDGWEYSSGDLWTLHLYQAEDDLTTRIQALIDRPVTPVAGEADSGGRSGALEGVDVAGLPILLTECGGVGYGQYGDEDFSYGDLPVSEAELERAIAGIAKRVNDAGVLQGFVWTQLTDIQQEINGLLYFDRTPKLPLATYKSIFGVIGE